MKSILFCLACLPVSLASANGVTQGQNLAQDILNAMGNRTIVCTSATDRVTLEKGDKGDLKMVARYAGNISGTLDTDNEGGGEECGGLAVKFNNPYSDYLLEDTYNDCERGDWGYLIMIPEAQVKNLSAKFQTQAYALDQESKDGATRTLECTVR